MSTFDLFATDTDVEESGDVLPGFGPLDTGLLKMVIKLAFLSESANGAYGLNLHLKNADGTGPEVRQTLWMTSGKAKGQRNTYVDQNGVKHKLPGMEQADNLHQLVDGRPMQQADSEEKIVKLWSSKTQKEENTPVQVITSLMDQPILVGMFKVRDNKQVKGDDGKYHPISEERFYNEINKFFDADTGLTHAEKAAKATEPAYLKKWKDSFPADYIRDKYKPVEHSIDADAAAAGIGTQAKALFP